MPRQGAAQSQARSTKIGRNRAARTTIIAGAQTASSQSGLQFGTPVSMARPQNHVRDPTLRVASQSIHLLVELVCFVCAATHINTLTKGPRARPHESRAD